MSTQEAWGAAVLRIVLGVVFMMHGYYGSAVLGQKGAASLITRIGYPAGLADLLAWYLIVGHTLGGALMLVGLWTRWAALAQIPIMASALFLLHLPQGYYLRGIVLDAAAGRAIAVGYELALLVLVASCAVALLGPGALSVDGARVGRRLPKAP